MKNVVVTTDNVRRGVFGGTLAEHDAESDYVVLTDARMAVYWSADVRGVLGLAATGPSKSCKITPAVPRIELNGVTAVMDMTDVAAKAWAEQPWGS
jgi:hypothetical protein